MKSLSHSRPDLAKEDGFNGNQEEHSQIPNEAASQFSALDFKMTRLKAPKCIIDRRARSRDRVNDSLKNPSEIEQKLKKLKSDLEKQ